MRFISRKNVLIVLALVISILTGMMPFPVGALDVNSYDFPNFTEADSMAFIEDHMIEIPTDLQKLDNLPKLTQELIIQCCENPNIPFNFNYSQIQEYAEDIRAAVSRYIDFDMLPTIVSASNYSLQYSMAQDANGNWSVNGGYFDPKWSYYNCYAYSIKREERSNFYGQYPQYDPGAMSGAGVFTECSDIWDLANIVREDLLAMGYTHINLYGIMPPSIDSSQELICVRMKLEIDYHFMRYDPTTDAWYHKPGPSAVLKYNGTPTNDILWNNERCFSDGAQAPTFEYDSNIVFITYSKNQIDVGQNSSSRKDINEGKDIFCEFSINQASYHWVNLNSAYPFEYEIYSEEFEEVFSGTGTIINLSLSNPGKYYLRVNFVSNSVSHYVDVIVEPHTHSYIHSYTWLSNTQHKSSCECDSYIRSSHVVAADAFTGGALRAKCLLCGGWATKGLLEPVSVDELYHSTNGSYILPNGIVVLVQEDIDAYMNGTLIFRLGEIA